MGHDRCHVYVLRSRRTGRRYVGSCQDVEARLREYNGGQSKSTRHAVPWELVHSESFGSRSEAMRQERFYKTGKGRDRLDVILRQTHGV